MNKRALYREYRPNKFSEVVGQEVAVKLLTKAFELNKVGHAYLFSGPRGTGKTSIARLFAKLLNCEEYVSDVCDKCSNCIDIKEGVFTDVIEIDAASNNGVKNIRDLIETIDLLPINSKYRIYIIDEVHMLSTEAFNAFLKVLEEPPTHIIFILATTEIYKIPATILSRCLRIEFNNLTDEYIYKHLRNICMKENKSYEDDALIIVAQAAEGAMRNALTYLEQLLVLSKDTIRSEDARLITGSLSNEQVDDLLKSLVNKDSQKALELIDEIVLKGIEYERIIKALINGFKQLINSKIESNLTNVFDEGFFNYIFNNLSELIVNIRKVIQPKTSLDVTILKICSYTKEINSTSIEVDNTSTLDIIQQTNDRIDSVNENNRKTLDNINKQLAQLKDEVKEVNSNSSEHIEYETKIDTPLIESMINNFITNKYVSKQEFSEEMKKRNEYDNYEERFRKIENDISLKFSKLQEIKSKKIVDEEVVSENKPNLDPKVSTNAKVDFGELQKTIIKEEKVIEETIKPIEEVKRGVLPVKEDIIDPKIFDLYKHDKIERAYNHCLKIPINEGVRNENKNKLRKIVRELGKVSSNTNVRKFCDSVEIDRDRVVDNMYNIGDDMIVVGAAASIELCKELMDINVRNEVVDFLSTKSGLNIIDYIVVPIDNYKIWRREIKDRIGLGHIKIDLSPIPIDVIRQIALIKTDQKDSIEEKIERELGIKIGIQE